MDYSYTVEEMVVRLGELEHFVLLAILRLGNNAYGVAIRVELRETTQREPSPGSLYTTLGRLEERGLVSSWLGDPTPQRGGRAKRFYAVTPKGLEAVARVQRSLTRLLNGLDIAGIAHA
ncbi:MAG TPA: PadR family transcriptional regulator [Bryobacteraceae bacterium]|nr:PadR family transcriptional regulator [Bryobacteraceae bacterium]